MLEVDIFNIDDFIKINNLQEVTNPILFEKDNIPTSDGLLSYEIFGRTTYDRSTIFAYINLNGHFIHPYIYKIWRRVDRKIEKIVSGIETFSINGKGEIVKDPNGWTGLEELYNHFDKIVFPAKEASAQKERVDLLRSLKKSEFFVSKWIVCPPFYRDMNINSSGNGMVSVHVKTKVYRQLLSLAKALKNDVNGIDVLTNCTRNKIQSILTNDIYTDNFMGEIKGKNGMFRKYVMGKSVDYSARFVISSPLFDVKNPDEMMVTFEKSGVPLSGVCTCFFPFIIKWLKDYFYNNIYLIKDKFPIMKNGKVEYDRIINAEQLIDDEYLTKAIDLYIHSYADRFKTIDIETKNHGILKYKIIGRYTSPQNSKSSTSSGIMNRACTWTDLLFIAATDVVKDKHVLYTRFPLEDNFGLCASKIQVLSTIDTVPMIINDKFYPYYPVIDPNLPSLTVAGLFRETFCVSNLYLKGQCADYDGDQETIRGVWTVEANKEAEDLIYDKKNLLDMSGRLVRTTEKEAIQTIFSLTANPDEFIA